MGQPKDLQNRENLNEGITLSHLNLQIRVLSSKIGGVSKTKIMLKLLSNKTRELVLPDL
jgi:hypothetical protein